MDGQSVAAQVPRIIRALTQIQGGEAINIRERRHPATAGNGGAGGGGGEERHHEFEAGGLTQPAIADDAEEVVITLHGGVARHDPDAIRRILDRLGDVTRPFGGIGPGWQARIDVDDRADRRVYDLVVFTDRAGGAGEFDALSAS